MRKRYIYRPITTEELAEVRSIIASANWKQSTSEEYRTAPHAYIIDRRLQGPGSAAKPEHWTRFADLIKNCGVFRTWRGHRMKYLIVDGMCYWLIWPVLNRADVATLDGGAAQTEV